MASAPAPARAGWRGGCGWLLAGLCLWGAGVLACRPNTPDSTGARWAQLGAPLSGAKIEPGYSGALALITVTRQEVDLCTATLLAPNLVATARHCVAPTSADSVSCADDPGAFAAPYAVNSLWVNHASTLSGPLESFGLLPRRGGADEFVPVAEVFVPDTEDVCGGDLALLVLSEQLAATEAAPLAPRLDDPVKRGDPYTALGFGDTPEVSGQGTRRSRSGLEVSCTPEDCDAPGAIEPTEFQGGDGVCSGDSGGPALDASGRVVGIASRSDNCTGSVYSAVSGWRDFIRDVAGRAARAGSYPAPEWLAPAPPEPEPEPVSDLPAAAPPEPTAAPDPAPEEEGAADPRDVSKHPIAATDAAGSSCSVARSGSERPPPLALLLGGCLGALALRRRSARRGALPVRSALLLALLAETCAPAMPRTSAAPEATGAPAAWLDRSLPPRARAERLVQGLTREEKLTLLTGYFGIQKPSNDYRFPEARPQSAGLVRGVPRVGFPPQWQTDAGSGVATQGEAPPELERTVLPSGLSTAATWNPALAEQAGAMIGSEARASGFNVLLAGGVNLMRDPANGRTFEYGGEDPLLAGTLVGALVRGIQSNHIVSTVKHFALNDQETGRGSVNVVIDEAAARLSDLLAFQIALEQGEPGAVMCSYNLINGEYACQNDWLLNQVLKHDWGFSGYVLSDWGGQHDTRSNAQHGLDQETGVQRRGSYQFLDKLAAAVEQRAVPAERLDDMAQRVAHSLIRTGAVDDPVQPGPIDFAAHARVSQADAEEGIVLLKNAGDVLPLAGTQRIAVIGGHADVGVLTGGGSAQVYAPGGNAVPGLEPRHWPGPPVYAKSSPLQALQAELPRAAITWNDGADPALAARAAAQADLALVFVTQWAAEARDVPLRLPDDQDRLVEAVARAQRRTVVVLETGGPVLLPWVDTVAGVVEAWYPGSQGGVAIARVLSGAVNPSGRLPVSFPRAAEQLPRPAIVGLGLPRGEHFEVHYDEGAAVGYRWYEQRGLDPLFAFGQGLSYTRFTHEALAARIETGELAVRFQVRNTGARAGKDAALVFVSPVAGGWEAPRRLGAFAKVELAAGAARELDLRVDPRLLALWDGEHHAFRVAAGQYQVTLAHSARESDQTTIITLPERTLPAGAGGLPH